MRETNSNRINQPSSSVPPIRNRYGHGDWHLISRWKKAGRIAMAALILSIPLSPIPAAFIWNYLTWSDDTSPPKEYVVCVLDEDKNPTDCVPSDDFVSEDPPQSDPYGR
jgi:hypothetical protein